MREHLSRTVGWGGYAGQTTRLADIDTEQLDPGTAQEVEQMAGELSARAQPPEPIGSDLLRYTITVTDGGSTRTIRFSDDGSPDVAPLLELVNALLARSTR
jgi:hypothetical protein